MHPPQGPLCTYCCQPSSCPFTAPAARAGGPLSAARAGLRPLTERKRGRGANGNAGQAENQACNQPGRDSCNAVILGRNPRHPQRHQCHPCVCHVCNSPLSRPATLWGLPAVTGPLISFLGSFRRQRGTCSWKPPGISCVLPPCLPRTL